MKANILLKHLNPYELFNNNAVIFSHHPHIRKLMGITEFARLEFPHTKNLLILITVVLEV